MPRRCAYTFAQDHFKCPSRGSRDRITQRPRRSALGREGIVAVPLKTWRRDEAVGKGPLDSNTYEYSSPPTRQPISWDRSPFLRKSLGCPCRRVLTFLAHDLITLRVACKAAGKTGTPAVRKRACAFDGRLRRPSLGDAGFPTPQRRGMVPRRGTVPRPKTPPKTLFFQNLRKQATPAFAGLKVNRALK